jgi:hypothetical protein
MPIVITPENEEINNKKMMGEGVITNSCKGGVFLKDRPLWV